MTQRDQFIARWGLQTNDTRAFTRDLDALLFTLPLQRKVPPIIENELAVIRTIFEGVDDGFNSEQIARQLNAKGLVAKRGGEFSGTQVSQYRRNAGTIQKAQQMGLA